MRSRPILIAEEQRLPESMTDAEIEFIETLGLITQSSGISRIAGRIWGALMVHESPMSAEELSQKLQVSRASISTNTRFLESLSILQRKSVPGERVGYFAIKDNPYRAMVENQIRQLTSTIEAVREAKLKMSSATARDRLEELEAFYEATRKAHKSVLNNMKKASEK